MQEKRKAARVEKTLIIQYAQSSPGLPSWDTTTIKNISVEGILFNSNKLFAKNERLQLRFIIPTDPSNRLEVVGEVVDSLFYKTRIKFINLGEHEKKLISDYVGCLLRNNKEE